MLMGTGSTMAEWDPALLRLLAREHRLILFDYPGLGRSGPWRGRSFGSLAEAAAGLLEAIDVPERRTFSAGRWAASSPSGWRSSIRSWSPA